MAAVGADAVASGPGTGLGAAHPAPASTSCLASSSTEQPLEHGFHLLLHSSPVEQGGVAHRSSCPQQVVPAGRSLPLLIT